MKKALLIIGGVIIVVVLIFGYLGFVPGVSALFGSNKPRDLGITWTKEDYAAAHQKTGVTVLATTPTSEQSSLSPEKTIIATGSHPAKIQLSGIELTAIINNNQDNWRYYPVRNVQVKIGDDGSAQISGILRTDRLAGYAQATGANYQNIQTALDIVKIVPQSLPFYLTGSARVTGNAVNLNLNKVELGRAPVPQKLITDNQSSINGFFTQQINAFPGFGTNTAYFNGGQLNFDGTLTDSIETYK